MFLDTEINKNTEGLLKNVRTKNNTQLFEEINHLLLTFVWINT